MKDIAFRKLHAIQIYLILMILQFNNLVIFKKNFFQFFFVINFIKIYLEETSQLIDGKCLRCANFLSKPQNTCTIPRVAEVTGSAKSPPGGDTLNVSQNDLN